MITPDSRASVRNIRWYAYDIAWCAERCPTPAVLAVLGRIPDATWRAMMATLRYPDDERALKAMEGHR